MKLIQKLIFAFLIFMGANNVSAQPIVDDVDDGRLVHIIGVGQMSCGKFIDYKNKGNKVQLDLFVTWTWGFLSAYNFRGNFGSHYSNVSNLIDNLPDSETVILFLTKDCENHPLGNVLQGVMRLIKSLGGEIVTKNFK